MDLFKITQNDITKLNDRVLETLIQTNRDLKINYQVTCSSVNQSKSIMEEAKNNFSKELNLRKVD